MSFFNGTVVIGTHEALVINNLINILYIYIDWRLFNGSSPNEGRLEYRPINGEWGSVCATTNGHERFVCEILGFQKVMSYYTFSSPSLFGISQGLTYDVTIGIGGRRGTYYIRRNSSCNHNTISSFRCTSGKYLFMKCNNRLWGRDWISNLWAANVLVLPVI